MDFDAVLTTLADAGFITAYEADGRKFACIPSFRRHQRINVHERASALPSPKRDKKCASMVKHENARASTSTHRNAVLGKEGKGRERKGTERNGTGTERNQKSKAGGSAENASPPPAPNNGAGALPQPSRNGHATWLTPYGQAWLTLYPDGEPPWGIMARWLRPLEKKHPPDVICAKMLAYFTTHGQYATWNQFAATFGDVKLARDPKIAAEDAAIGAMARDLERRMKRKKNPRLALFLLEQPRELSG